MTDALFWFSLAGLFYIYLGYPLLIGGLAALHPLHRKKAELDQQVSIVIACHNEANNIRHKVSSLLQSDQGRFIAEILIGSDGSTDDTAGVLSRLDDDRVILFEFKSRRGKPAILNELIPQCRSEIIVLCDARQELSEQAIPALLSGFADSKVGVVSGELVFRDADSASATRQGIGAYWRYEKMIRKSESGFRSVPGATGALYAIRRSLFRQIPESTLLDDVVIPMQAVVQGGRCVFESEAIAFDDPSESLGKESVRKRRTIAGAAQLLVHHPAWLVPWKNPIWFEFVSHKMLRLASPLLLGIVAITNVLLIEQSLFQVLGALHTGFYASGAIGWLLQKTGKRSSLCGIPLMFIALNATTVAAIWDAMRGRFQVTWQRTTTMTPDCPDGDPLRVGTARSRLEQPAIAE